MLNALITLHTVFAVVVCVAVAYGGAQRISRRYRLAWTNPDALAGLANWSPSTTGACSILAFVQLVSGCILFPLLVVDQGSALLGAVALAVGSTGSAVALFFQTGRRFSGVAAASAVGLLALGLTGFVTVVLVSTGHDPITRIACALLALATQVWLWAWLAGVWNQQLDNGIPWTTAGQLIAWTPRFALGCAVVAICLAATVLVLVLRQAGTPPLPTSAVVSLIVGHVVLLAGAIRAWRQWRHPLCIAGIALTVLSSAALLYASHRA
jgi:hypothetical protein